MAVTTHRPVPLPHAQVGPEVKRKPVPEGAAKMQPWYIDKTGMRKRMPYDVPVTADDARTQHVRCQCPHMRNVNGGGRERCAQVEWLLPGQTRYCPDHGEALEPPKDGDKAKLAALVGDAYRMYGKAALPWVIPAGGVAADWGMSLGQVAAMEAILAAPALAGAGYVVAKRLLLREAIRLFRIEKGQKAGRRVRQIERRARWRAAVAGEIGLWAAALAATDMSTWPGRIVVAAGMVRWAVGFKPMWDGIEARRAHTPAPVKVEVPAEVVPEAPDPVQLRALTTWATLIGCSGGPLAGTELVEFSRLPNCPVRAGERTMHPNWTAKVVAKVAGSINMRESRPNLLGRIAAAYGCTYADVSFTADESDLSVATLRVQPDNLLAETKMWAGPSASDWRRGTSRVGRFDDSLDIVYQWWTKTGAAHDLISGCTGSGKSEVVAQLLLASLHSNGLVLDWVGDPQGGQSYGQLKDAVDWFARDKSEITLMLLAALKEMLRRNDELAANNIKTWQPTKAMPLLVITLDEVQSYIEDPAILELVEKLVGQGRKCGIKLRLITQIPAAYNLGGSTYIKEQLKAGQTLIFRAMTDIAGRSAVEGDCPVDPTLLPSVWGKKTCAAGETTAGLMFVQGLNGRDVYGRADWTGDDMARWLVDDEGASTLNPGRFGPDAQQVSGVLWGDRKERARRLIEAGRSDADLLRNGAAVELIEAAAQAAATKTVVRLAGQTVEPEPDSKGPRSRDVVFVAARDAADDRGLVARDVLVRAVKGQMADGTLNKALSDLVADGALRRVKNGLYEVPGAVKVPAGSPEDEGRLL